MSSSNEADSLYRIRTSSADIVHDNFCQRQMDVFASLAGLEAAHVEVTKATKDERKAVQKASWRRATPAPENLVAEKECRDHAHQSERQAGQQQFDSEFRKPKLPKPHRKTVRRDPKKWTHYTLADVDEDGGVHCGDGSSSDSNFAIAASFLNELRERHVVSNNEEEMDVLSESEAGNKQPHRILFRPTSGLKRSRTDCHSGQLLAEHSPTRSAAADHYRSEEDSALNDSSLAACSSVDPATDDETKEHTVAFCQRRQKRHIRTRISDSSDVIGDGAVTRSDSESIEELVEQSSESCIDDEDNQEDEDVGNDGVVDYLA
ncbi:unnamed protein product [Calicophoron daubneyi]|uniref:Protein TSSC4 n=1 Tax=Calicophoron daubneyi TaxID=300641 RepID=A0AAV2T0W4_CALDB